MGDLRNWGEESKGRGRRTPGMGKGDSGNIEKGFKRRKELSEKAKGEASIAGSLRST